MNRKQRKAYLRAQERERIRTKKRNAYTQFLVGRDNRGELDDNIQSEPDLDGQKRDTEGNPPNIQ